MARTFHSWLRTRSRGAVIIAVGVVLMLPLAPTAAHAASNGWTFSGAVSSPVRDGDGLISVSGNVVVPSCPDQARGCWLALHRMESGTSVGWVPVRVSGSPLVFRTAGVFAFKGSATVSGGTWELAVVAGIDGAGARQGNVIADNLTSVVASPWVAKVTRLTVASTDFVVQGDSLTISAVDSVLWNDGVITTRPVSGYGELAWRPTGAGLWDRVASGETSATVTPAGPGDYRYVVDGTAATTVFVNVARPTSAARIADPTVSPTEAIANSTITLTTTMETQYDDKEWRPSPIGTKFELQFLAEGGTAWARLYTNSVVNPGQVEVRFPMLTSGRYRIAVGSATSLSVPVTAIIPTSTIALEALDLPIAVEVGEPIDVSVGAEVLYTDGVYRDVPDDTPFIVQFAESTTAPTSPTMRAKLKWRTVKQGRTQAGQITTRIAPRSSGYWKIKCGKTQTPPRYISLMR